MTFSLIAPLVTKNAFNLITKFNNFRVDNFEAKFANCLILALRGTKYVRPGSILLYFAEFDHMQNVQV